MGCCAIITHALVGALGWAAHHVYAQYRKQIDEETRDD